DGAIHRKASVAGSQPLDHFLHHHRPVDEILWHASVPQLCPAPNNVVTRFQIFVPVSDAGAAAVSVFASSESTGAAFFFSGSGFATTSKSVSLRSFRITFTLSSDSSP